MKKIITLIAAAAMLAVSCQKETPETYSAGNTDNQSAPGKLTATIAQTKVSYAETPELNLQPAWEVGDEIIGFDDAGSTYTFTVASITDGTATLYADKEINDGTYHLIYKSGASAGDISSKSLAIDYTAQAGDKTMPAVMLADGTVINGICEFEFANAGAIVGISAVKGVPANSEISKITVEGDNLSGATVALDGSALKLTATAKTGDAVSTATLSGITADAQGQLKKGGNNTIIYVAVPAGAVIAKVSATVGSDTYTYTLASAKTATAGAYLYVRTQEFDKDSGLPAGALPGEFSVSATKKVHFSKGNLYADGNKALNFEANQYSSASSWDASHVSHFTWSSTVEAAVGGNNSGDYLFCDESHKVSVDGGEAIYYALSKDEWTYLFNTRTMTNGKDRYSNAVSSGVTIGGETYKGVFLYPDNYNGEVVSSSMTWDAINAAGIVFLPAAGYRSGSRVSTVGDYGYYWYSTAYDESSAYIVFFNSYGVSPGGSGTRRVNGVSVRLVTESN